MATAAEAATAGIEPVCPGGAVSGGLPLGRRGARPGKFDATSPFYLDVNVNCYYLPLIRDAEVYDVTERDGLLR